MSIVAGQPQTGSSEVKGTDLENRSDIGGIVGRFQKLLGDKWDGYQTSISLFLVGKSSRDELMAEIADVLQNLETKKLHNQLLVAMLANSFKSHSMDGVGGGFGSQRKRKNISKSSHWDQIKKVVLSLPIRERMRIKAITRESGKKGMTSNIIVQTRQALVPKVPILTGTTPEAQNKNLARTMVSVKDILDMVNAPLCTETYELPERTALRDKMIGCAREHGVLGSVTLKAADVLYLGLQFHLKSLISAALDNVGANVLLEEQEATINNTDRKRKRKRIVLTMEDIFDSFALTPHLIEPYGSMDLLTDVMLKNDDDYDILTRYKKNSGYSEKREEEELISTGPGGPVYVVPDKISPISYLLRPKSSFKKPKLGKDETPETIIESNNVGTPDELTWLVNDLLAAE